PPSCPPLFPYTTLFRSPQHIGAPSIQWDRHAYGGAGGVAVEGEFFASQLQLVEERTAHGTDGEGGDARFDEDQHPHGPGQQFRAAPGRAPPPALRPSHTSGNAARDLDERDQSSDKEAEKDDPSIAGVAEHGDQLLDQPVQPSKDVPIREDERADVEP